MENKIENKIKYNYYECFSCNSCHETVTPSWYQLGSIDFCLNCMENLEMFQEIEEKPLSWPCIICKKLLGGGHKWLVFDNTLDLCYDCYRDVNFKSKFKNLFNLVNNIKGRFFDYDYGIPIRIEPKYVNPLIDLSFLKELSFFIDIREDIEVTLERIREIPPELNVNNIVFLNPIDNEGYETKYGEYFCDFIVDVSTGKIYSYVIDDHGRCAFNFAYDSYIDYKKEYYETNLINKKLYGSYYRSKHDLGFYYG